MSGAALRVGIVDSGGTAAQLAAAAASAAFVLDGGEVRRISAQADQVGHGSALLGLIGAAAPSASVLVAQVFRDRLATSARQVAAAIDWLTAGGAQLINLSLGLRDDRPVLAEACARALAAGVVLCAASPARGGPVHPAAYPGVLRMTGDARCALDEISHLATAQADFGAHVEPPPGSPIGAGASVACGRLSALVAGHLAAGGAPGRDDVHAWLAARARYHGPERRRA